MLCHAVLCNSVFLAVVESQWKALLSGMLLEGVSSPHLLNHTESLQRKVKQRIFLWKIDSNWKAPQTVLVVSVGYISDDTSFLPGL